MQIQKRLNQMNQSGFLSKLKNYGYAMGSQVSLARHVTRNGRRVKRQFLVKGLPRQTRSMLPPGKDIVIL